MSHTSKAGAIVAGAVTAAVLVIVGALVFQGGRDPAVRVSDGAIVIEGMYGLTVNFSDITGISLLERSMSDMGAGRKTNGYGGFGDALKGHFRSEELGDILLFVQSRTPVTVYVERESGKDIYISLRDAGATRALYDEMTAAFVA